MTDVGRAAFIAWAKKACRPLAGTDETGLEALAAVVGRACVVGLGESWHSTAELLALKYRMVRFLVERLSFDVVAFEGGMPGTPAANAYVVDGAGDAVAALRALGQPMWLNPESVALLEWLRARNAAQPADAAIRVAGIDPAYPGAAIGTVLDFLAGVDPGWEAPHRALLEAVAHDLLAVPLDSRAKSAVWGATEVHDRLEPAAQAQFHAACAVLVARLVQFRAAYRCRGTPAAYEWALQQATVLLQAGAVVRVRARSLAEANVARDHGFAENLAWLHAQGAGKVKLVVLAHNIHIAREPFRSAPDGPPVTSMGGHLAEWLGDKYVAIGSAVGRGGDGGLAGVAADAPTARLAAAEGSNDAALEELGPGPFLLSMAGHPAWVTAPRVMRSHLEPQPEYCLGRSFDAVFYVDRISRCAALP